MPEYFGKKIPASFEPVIDRRAIREIAEIEKAWPPKVFPQLLAVPEKIDLSENLHFVRCQMGAGCWGYSMLAVWDIMNEMACPYSPNLSMRLWMMMHRRRELWENQGGISSPDGRFHKMKTPEFGFLQSFGNPTEGTELTLHNYPSLWPDGGWSREGVDEADNYRLKSEPQKINVASQDFISSLLQGKPIRLGIGYTDPDPNKSWGHFVAIVGYDKTAKTFKYVNSVGDNWGQDGFGTYTFQEIDNHKAGVIDLDSAEIVEICPPKPVPAARISFKHTNRSNVHLRLSAENSPLPKNKIWPQGWDENSRNLSFTVRLPSEFIWPPLPSNRLVLDLFDSAEFSNSGGKLEEFTAAFGGHVLKCSALSNGPVSFNPLDHQCFHIP